jgi:hypothetical protein
MRFVSVFNTSSLKQKMAALVTCLGVIVAVASGPAQAAPSPPTASSGVASSITSSSVTLTGSTYPSNQQTEYYFQYGFTSAYGLQTPTTVAGSGKETIHVVAAVAGLSPYATYHYRLVAINASGTTDGVDRSFTTKKIPLTFAFQPLGGETFERPFSIAGTLAGTGSADHTLVLQANPFPFLGSFKNVGSPTTTDANGAFTFRIGGLALNTQFRVSTLEQPVVKSDVVVARVRVRVVLHVEGTARPGFARFSGTVTPGEPAARVSIQYLGARGRPSPIGGILITSRKMSSSPFSRTLRIRHHGLYRANVQVVSGAQTSSHSRAILVG